MFVNYYWIVQVKAEPPQLFLLNPTPHEETFFIQYADTINTRGSQGRIFGIATGQQVGWSKVKIPEGARDFSLVKNIQAGPWANLAFCLVGAGFVSQR